jgi:hypothetical protein
MNEQPTRELQQFQKLVVQHHYINALNKKLDELEWEGEKKDTIIEMRDNEILDLKHQASIQSLRYTKLEREFKEFTAKVKLAKTDNDKINKQQELINLLKHELNSVKERLQVSNRMNQLLARQNRK